MIVTLTSKVLRKKNSRSHAKRNPCGSHPRTIKRFSAAVYDSIGPAT
jgi:hypothetical protein